MDIEEKETQKWKEGEYQPEDLQKGKIDVADEAVIKKPGPDQLPEPKSGQDNIARTALGSGFIFWVAVLTLIGVAGWFYPTPDGSKAKPFWLIKDEKKKSANKVVQGKMKPVKLVLPEKNGEWLVIVDNEIEGNGSIETDIERTLKALFKTGAQKLRLFPIDIVIRDVFIYDDVAVVSFGGEIRKKFNPGVWTEMLALYSMVNTVVENFDAINRLQIIIDDKQTPIFINNVAINKPLLADPSLMQSETSDKSGDGKENEKG